MQWSMATFLGAPPPTSVVGSSSASESSASTMLVAYTGKYSSVAATGSRVPPTMRSGKRDGDSCAYAARSYASVALASNSARTASGTRSWTTMSAKCVDANSLATSSNARGSSTEWMPPLAATTRNVRVYSDSVSSSRRNMSRASPAASSSSSARLSARICL